ncbi:MAG: HAD-IA family hydrolase [Paludibacteraceae bacterium]|nr:HAD-IA family hydrolase [Paludibacteraceae bacterium]
MSDDYPIAIECGATSVRIGSAIFGERSLTGTKSTSLREKRSYSEAVLQSEGRSLPRALFFDQDGILFDSMPNHAKAWEEVMSSYGLPLTAYDVYVNEGRTGRAVIEEALSHVQPSKPVDIEAVYHAKSEAFRRLNHGELPPLIPGVKEVLEYLHAQGVQCWVVTGSGERSLLDNLEKTFPGIFSGFITAFDVTHGKPDPEPYLKAWERTGFNKSECAVVENAPLGVRAGKAAGLFTIAVNTGILPDSDLAAEQADRIFPNMSALLDWLKAQN